MIGGAGLLVPSAGLGFAQNVVVCDIDADVDGDDLDERYQDVARLAPFPSSPSLEVLCQCRPERDPRPRRTRQIRKGFGLSRHVESTWSCKDLTQLLCRSEAGGRSQPLQRLHLFILRAYALFTESPDPCTRRRLSRALCTRRHPYPTTEADCIARN